MLWLPNWMTPWRQEALAQRQRNIAYLTRIVGEVKAKMDAGQARPSFCKQLLEQQAKLGMTDLEIAYSCGTPFGAGRPINTCNSDDLAKAKLSSSGVETSMATILSFILACVEFGEECVTRGYLRRKAILTLAAITAGSSHKRKRNWTRSSVPTDFRTGMTLRICLSSKPS